MAHAVYLSFIGEFLQRCDLQSQYRIMPACQNAMELGNVETINAYDRPETKQEELGPYRVKYHATRNTS